jgi:hypothetical protein
MRHSFQEAPHMGNLLENGDSWQQGDHCWKIHLPTKLIHHTTSTGNVVLHCVNCVTEHYNDFMMQRGYGFVSSTCVTVENIYLHYMHSCMNFFAGIDLSDRLCGLVVRVLGYRSGGSGSIPGTTRKQKK